MPDAACSQVSGRRPLGALGSAVDIADTRVHRHLIPGRGAIDFQATIGAIAATGYDGWLTVELYPYIDSPDEAAREAHQFMTALLARLAAAQS